MRKIFQADMKAMGDSLAEIASLVVKAIEQAQTAFENQDIQLAETVISEDARIDYLQTSIDENAIELLMLQAPVATDLRTLVAALRMSSSLERMGDLARHIALLTRMRYPEHVIPEPRQEAFSSMIQQCVDAARELHALIETQDLDHTKAIMNANSQINEIHAENFRVIAEPAWDASAAQTADTTLASRYLERFADHAVSVARKVSYLVTGDWQPKPEGV